MPPIALRPIDDTEWERFRDLRIAALLDTPQFYSGTFAESSRRTESEWRALIHGDDRQLFGLFDDDTLIGITGVFTSRDDPTGTTAMLGMSYIAPAYRGRGLARLFYETRLAWVRTHPSFAKVVVSHRASNHASQRANQRFGFVPTRRAPRVWPDGSTEDELFYELRLER